MKYSLHVLNRTLNLSSSVQSWQEREGFDVLSWKGSYLSAFVIILDCNRWVISLVETLLSIGVELAQAHLSAGLCFHRILACNSQISLHFLVRDFFISLVDTILNIIIFYNLWNAVSTYWHFTLWLYKMMLLNVILSSYPQGLFLLDF